MNLHSHAPHFHCQPLGYETRRKGAFARLAGAALLAAALSAVSLAQKGPSITVRVLNSENGKPLKGVLLLVDAPSNEPRSPQYRLLADARTNANGVAIVHLRKPIPEIFISYGDADVGRCTPWSAFITEEILKTGVVGANTCSDGKFQYTVAPKPGKLVLFGKKWSWWERMKHSE